MMLTFILLSGHRDSNQGLASAPQRGRSSSVLPPSVALSNLRLEDREAATADGVRAARSVILMGRCLVTALEQARDDELPYLVPVAVHSSSL